MRKIFYLLIFIIGIILQSIPLQFHGQNFSLTGSAIADAGNPGCYILTDGTAPQMGAFWNPQKISLNDSFDLDFYVRIQPNGAPLIGEGMQFVLQNSTSSVVPSGLPAALGYSPAPGTQCLSVEIDYRNNGGCEIGSHHTAIHQNGNLALCSSPAVLLLAGGVNVNNGNCHNFRISWKPATFTMRVYFDGINLITRNYDLKTNLFLGQDSVYWGFTGATSAGNLSDQRVCYNFAQAGRDTFMCAGNSISLNASGSLNPLGYVWNPPGNLSCTVCPSPTFSPPNNIFPNTHNFGVTVTNALGCSKVDSVRINSYPKPNPSIFPDSVLCAGDSLMVSLGFSPSFSISWMPSASVVSPSSPFTLVHPAINTQYLITVTDTTTPADCQILDTVNINVNPLPAANAGPDVTSCTQNASMNGTLAGGTTINWSCPSPFVNIVNPALNNTAVTTSAMGNFPMIYSVVHNGTGCSAQDTAQLIIAGPLSSFAGNDQNVCGDSILLIGNLPGGLNGNWLDTCGSHILTSTTPDTLRASGLLPGAQAFVWVISNSTCSDSDTVVIMSTPVSAKSGKDSTFCGSSYTTQGSGAGSWSALTCCGTIINPASPVTMITGLPQGSHQFLFSDTIGACISADTLNLVSYLPQYADAGKDSAMCQTTTFFLQGNVASPGSMLWTLLSGTTQVNNQDSANAFLTNTSPGLISLEFSITNGVCNDRDTVIIQADSLVLADAGPDQTACGNVFQMNGNPSFPGTGNWSQISGGPLNIVQVGNPTTTINQVSTGTHILTWEIQSGKCNSLDTVVLNKAGNAQAFAGNDTTFCADQITLNASPPGAGQSGNWIFPSPLVFDNPQDPATEVSGFSQGSYKFLWVVNENACSDTDSVVINAFLPVSANAGPDQNITEDETQLSANIPSAGIGIWQILQGVCVVDNPLNPASNVSNIQQGYTLLEWIVTNSPCPVARDTMLITYLENIFVPDGFSPNGDNVNDDFVIRGIENYPDNTLFIFNRWGNLEYSRENYLNQWKGENQNGNPLTDDTYYYVLELGTGNVYKGFVVIKR